MVLLKAASDFFLHFGVGTLMALALIREPELKKSFYQFTATLCAVFISFGLFMGDWTLPGIGYLVASLPFVVGFYALYSADHAGLARASLLAAITLGLIGLFGMLAYDEGKIGALLNPWQHALLIANTVTSLCLAGIVLCTLVLGHWYLLSPRLSFRPLVHGALLFFWAVWLRLAILVAILVAFGWANGMTGRLFLERLLSWDDFGMFFLLRVFWGIIGPLVLSFMVYKTAQIQSNQSATGILYVALVFVLIGELISNYLWALAGISV